MTEPLPRYELNQTYRWNYDRAPQVAALRDDTGARTTDDVAPFPGEWTFCGLSVDSPLGIPAGPLLNGKWVLYYAELGFDVLTYKTVRSVQRDCYPLPNLQPVNCRQLLGTESDLAASKKMDGSWAVSFGMPSTIPDEWRADIEATRNALDAKKILSVSVVGSIQDGWSIDDLARDYAQCARWAIQSGADVVEANFSCPNVSTCDGQLYQQPQQAGVVAATIREQIGDVPFVVKIGHVTELAEAQALLELVGPHVTAIALTNSVAARVRGMDGSLLFEGARRGICGDATRTASIEQTRMIAGLIRESAFDTRLIGVGGVSTAAHVREYLEAGAESTHIATAAMLDPCVALKIRSGWK